MIVKEFYKMIFIYKACLSRYFFNEHIGGEKEILRNIN